ncbi:hypothetical protein PMIN03_001123 [Paraphaeosphaeria minitans]
MPSAPNPPQPSPFLRGWTSLPPELRLQILSYILIIPSNCFKDPRITIWDYIHIPFHRSRKRFSLCGRFANIALPLLACPYTDAAFNMPQAALEMWYGQNTFHFGGIGRGCGEKLMQPYMTPNPNAFAYLQHVRMYIQGDYAGWMDLARYCEATKSMSKLKTLEVEFVRQARPDADSKSLRDAFADVGALGVHAEKFVLEYHGKSELLGLIRPPFMQDRWDYPDMAVVFENISVVVCGEKAVKEVVQRYWYDCVTRVDVDEMWELPPKSTYPWQKYVVRTQWC